MRDLTIDILSIQMSKILSNFVLSQCKKTEFEHIKNRYSK